MTPVYWGLGGLVIFWLLSVWYGRHKQLVYRFGAHQRLRQLAALPTDREKFLFLKDTHHFVFEEMILTAFKRKGHRIRRNRAYTGDGGIDGRVTIKGRPFYIQAKRYRDHINPRHIREFAQVCRRDRVRGLFIHTGKTGPESWKAAQRYQIRIISGQRLLGLLSPPRKSSSKTSV